MQAGVVVNSLGISQMSFEITKELNKIQKLDEYWDIILFYHSYDKSVKSPLFAMLQEEELWGFDAPVIANDLSTADRLLKCPRPTKKFLYMWDLQWTYSNYNIDELASIYMNEDLQLICRSDVHANITETCWKKPVAVIEGFNYEEITRVLSQ